MKRQQKEKKLLGINFQSDLSGCVVAGSEALNAGDVAGENAVDAGGFAGGGGVEQKKGLEVAGVEAGGRSVLISYNVSPNFIYSPFFL